MMWPAWYRPPLKTRARVADIVTVASRLTGLSVEDIMGPTRFRPIILVRHAVYFVAREQGYSFPQIGARLNRDHSSVIHGRNVAQGRAERDPDYASFLWELAKAVRDEKPFVSLPPSPITVTPPAPVAAAPIVVRVPRAVKAVPPSKKLKNQFNFEQGETDSGNRFHCSIAMGSKRLAAAIHEARTA